MPCLSSALTPSFARPLVQSIPTDANIATRSLASFDASVELGSGYDESFSRFGLRPDLDVTRRLLGAYEH